MAPKPTDENQNDEDKKMDKIPMVEGIRTCERCVELFFMNKFDESLALAEVHKDTSMFHALGTSYVTFVFAIFTMEKDQIERAMKYAQNAMNIAQNARKKSSIGQSMAGWFSKTDYNEYTDEEAHAELCYADLNFIMMLLHFIGEQTLMSIVRGARKFMACNSALKVTDAIVKGKTNWESEYSSSNFECGAYMSSGFVNLVFSHLPGRVLKLVTIVGISADRDLGLGYLHIATDKMTGAFRSKIACFLVCFYSFYLEQFFGLGEADMPWIRSITKAGLDRYPNGAFDLFWSARYYQLHGEPEKAIELFEKCIASQHEFKQMHNVCRWDLLWSYAIKCDWASAAACAKNLQENCQWSPATNAYQYACFTYMIMDEENRPELRSEVDKAMASVPEYRQRIAGKTLPPEKFAIIMSTRYAEGEKDMALPALVLFYIWNIYGNSAEKTELLVPLLERINKKLPMVRGDTYYVMLLLKGVCLRNMKRPEEALDCFVEILHAQDSIVKENYVPPHAAFELGMTYKDVKNYDDAKIWLEKARDTYSGFLIESLVHLRIHGALAKLRELKSEM